MCAGGLIGAAGPAIGGALGFNRFKDVFAPPKPEVGKIPPPLPAPEKSATRVRRRASLDPTVTDRPTGGLDLFTLELTDLFPK